MPRPKQAAPLVAPPAAHSLLTKEMICRLLSYSPRAFDALVSSGDYPRADLMLNRLPRWRVETHNAWIEGRVEQHKHSPRQ